jgi:biopolymer transport protein ExbB
MYLCQGHPSAISRIYQAALKIYGQPRAMIKEVVQEVGRREASDLMKFIPVLATVASIAPLLGLLGTVSGMIKTFNVISYYGVGSPGSLAGGISEALLTTAAGLCVAIPTLVGYRYISAKADGLISEMEEQSLVLVEALKAPENGHGL